MKKNKIQKVPGSSSIEVDNTVHEFVAGDKSHLQSDDLYQMLTQLIHRVKQSGCELSTTSILQELDD